MCSIPSTPARHSCARSDFPRDARTGRKSGLFRTSAFVSRLPICRGGGRDRQKSPAVSANIPILGRLSAEAGSIRLPPDPGTRFRPDLPSQSHGKRKSLTRSAARPLHSIQTSSPVPIVGKLEYVARTAARGRQSLSHCKTLRARPFSRPLPRRTAVRSM